MASPTTKVDGRREDPRLRVRAIADLVTGAGMQSAQLINISREGAGIRASVPLKPGSGVILRWEHIDDFARVTWVDGTRCGLMFQQPLTAAEVVLARTLAGGIPAAPSLAG